ncbi:3-methyl-2-oxobutanoate hydroxymethyltransferase [Chromobacterium piscinae]|uniref:3-methyl-2-oxobutanoate hydroxymethyltransferase n=1 Tax=Chromobacterium piscinae TaxID=686831 RepID=A0ABV0H7M7_9NEIS|nr:3-methyl-2-oxobutanoate hydroxymethyltransferase [Chromobacterium piscinae]MBX9298551.1 3-methyl-2-oxobutanoate hydroxymethyltransferase [Chromobacterium vaccinii]MBX9347965.1 3-methyl-2-oxobutanoate hydroxymethyltransferase [Chromobacterium vaccinii]MBX9357946.1 3-methyl-2-oxobutanoate hydroxymethyltransferase [Chromobacterium vaccinii]MCD4505630.1 3-methyl-2-oxobutanoate hydroxymethyltransferase [Chromobacterium piscinae]MCD5330271.1 3-methyl-2-oxobutanoate hydroxymethyltransferase [Chrom
MKITVNTLHKLAAEGQKISMLTCYDASFASLLDEAGVEILLVGDSLGPVMQGVDSTLPVSEEDMLYHIRCVARGSKNALILGDMTFGAYQESPQQAFAHAARLLQAGAHMVKLEGGAYMAETTRFLVERGIPVCSHIGLTPQYVNMFGGYRVQGRGEDAQRILNDAKVLAEAGASLVLMECVPAPLAKEITEAVKVPTIGIGAGADTSGQVLVLHDMLGVYPGKKAKFVKNFMEEAGSIQGAVQAYVKAVKDQSFPAAEHTY